ncbi:FabD/lysophospholipase-like protein [Tuber magnatum]|uniref:FabD/lysophospholipase-like protein n=1 Tax=Tuber magnatum TaxID=42249 RepID=A0A317SRS6_9PEZI|nr:FabD/lysophospholipase-like protein [Tuber magnatum]
MAELSLPPLRILSLDGGGVRGLSSLMILQDIMTTISQQEKSSNIRPKHDDTPLKPCEYFDIIGGTSTGGIIAILLSRLRLDVPTCIDIYTQLAEEIFSKDRSIRIFGTPLRFAGARFSGAVLEKAIKRVLVKKGFDPEERMFDETLSLREKEIRRRVDTDQLAKLEVTHSGGVRDVIEKKPWRKSTNSNFFLTPERDSTPESKTPSAQPPELGCHGIVVAVYKHAVGVPKLFHTNDPTDRKTKIWQALRATSAAPTFFDEITFGTPKITYIDGGLGYNSPCAEIDFEAKARWPGREIGVIVSIGTGLQTIPAIRRGFRWLPFGLHRELSLAGALVAMATSTARVDNEVQRMYRDAQTEYYRWDVDSGLGEISLEQWMKEDEMGSVTRRYLDDPDQVIRRQGLARTIVGISTKRRVVECSAGRFTIAPALVGEEAASWSLENMFLPGIPRDSCLGPIPVPVLEDLDRDGTRAESQILCCNRVLASSIDLRTLISGVPTGRYMLRYILRSLVQTSSSPLRPPGDLILSAGKPYDARTFANRFVDRYISTDVVPTLLYPDAVRVRVTAQKWAVGGQQGSNSGWFEVSGGAELVIGAGGQVGVVVSCMGRGGGGDDGQICGGWGFGGVRLVPI